MKPSRIPSLVAAIGMAAALAALGVGATSCAAPVESASEVGSADSEAPGEEDTGEAQQHYFAGLGGFFHTPETGTKILAVWPSYYCWVLDPGELDAISITNYWGENTQTTSLWAIAQDRPGSSNQYCPWPNGMLVRDNAVYLIQNGTSCHIVDNEQVAHHGGWQAVWWPSRPSNEVKFDWVTRYTGDCTW